MKKFVGLALFIFISACGSDEPSYQDGLAGNIAVQADRGAATTDIAADDAAQTGTYSDAKARIAGTEAAHETAQNERSFNALRANGFSEKDAAEVVDTVREMCPHSDASGKCY